MADKSDENVKKRLRVLFLSVLLPLLVVTVISGAVLLFLSNKQITRYVNSESRNALLELDNRISEYLAPALINMQDFVSISRDTQDKEVLDALVHAFAENIDYTLSFYYSTAESRFSRDGFYVDSSDWVPDDDWIPQQRPWFVSAKDTNELCYEPPYVDDMTGGVCVSLSQRVDDRNGEFQGVVALDLLMKDMEDMVNSVSVSPNGKIYMLLSDGTYLTNEDEAKVTAANYFSDSAISYSAGEYLDGEKKSFIEKVLSEEEAKFNKTIDQGLAILADLEKDMEKAGKKVLDGAEAFRLYDTFGFPLDLTMEILEEKGFSVDEDGFKKCMEVQRTTARDARGETNYMGKDASVYDEIDAAVTSCFIGYDGLEGTSKITVLTTADAIVDEIGEGTEGTIIVDDTPFYGTMGGQIGDIGEITTADGARFVVVATEHLQGGKIAHIGKVESGTFKVGGEVSLSVDRTYRMGVARHHSATHLLQRALREVLGDHVQQAGSEVRPDRLRFDFTHFSAMTADELSRVENMVNERIAAAVDVQTDVMCFEEAKKTGAMALFGEKYGDEVRVVRMGDYSTELCGGTHVKNTSDIQVFKILSESSVASGVRRIEAITGSEVFAYYRENEKLLNEAAAVLKTEPAKLAKRIEALQKELKELKSENESLKSAQAKDALGDVSDAAVEVGGLSLIARAVSGVDMNGLRDLGDQLKASIGEGVVVLASDAGGKVSLVAMATDGAVAKGAHAGNLIKEIAPLVGGGGGGRPNMAQAGGKNPAGIDDAIAKVADVLAGQVG